MNREPVVSSNLVSVGYDPNSYTLEIEFMDGRIYQYFDVPEQVYDELLNANSAGQYFHRQVRGVYNYARL